MVTNGIPVRNPTERQKFLSRLPPQLNFFRVQHKAHLAQLAERACFTYQVGKATDAHHPQHTDVADQVYLLPRRLQVAVQYISLKRADRITTLGSLNIYIYIYIYRHTRHEAA